MEHRQHMQICMDEIDWNQLKAFLATAQAGSLSAAARRLRLSQPTLSRQVAAIERQLGVTLFERVGKLLVLTGTGEALLAHAQAMGTAAEALGMAASGRTETAAGVVAVSASDAVAAWLLPPLLRQLREREPGITIELISFNGLSDLQRREADIAVRHVKPEQPELIARLVREATAGFYASQEWVRAHGHPRSAAEAATLPFVGVDRSGRFLSYLQAHGLPLTEANFSAYAEHSVAHWALVQQGLGIGAMMDDIAERTPGVVRVLDEVPPVRFPIWLVAHRELRTARRIRMVFDALAAGLVSEGPGAVAGIIRQ